VVPPSGDERVRCGLRGGERHEAVAATTGRLPLYDIINRNLTGNGDDRV
jgi:hypothetical protein